jgi:hypothetical protein
MLLVKRRIYMAFRALTLLATLQLLTFLSGCGTDTKTTANLGATAGQSHYGGVFVDGNDNPNNRAQYLGYSLQGTVNVGGTGNGTSPPPAYTTVDYSISCLSCHPNGDTKANAAILEEYATTGHADVTAIPWTIPEIGGTCQRCHTTFGFLHHLENYAPVNYDPATPYRGITLSSPDISPQWTGTILSTPLNQREEYRKTMQVLICSACHPENGLVTGELRVPVTPGGFVAIWSANSITALATFPDAGASNLCIRCHSARRAGPNITAVATTTAHYRPAAATVFSGTTDLVNITANTTSPLTPPLVATKFTGVAYEFSGQSYVTPERSHKNVGGAPGNEGPCVGCHMSGTAGHTLKAVVEDAAGEIVAINSNACVGCHGAILPTWLNDKKTAFTAAVAELDGLLQNKGFYFNPENETFYKDAGFSIPLSADATSLGITTAEATRKYYDNQAAAFALDKADLRGAAFNLWLFRFKAGDRAAYVHNSNYTKKVLFDSINLLNGGVFPGDIDPVAAAYLDGNSSVAGVQRP